VSSTKEVKEKPFRTKRGNGRKGEAFIYQPKVFAVASFSNFVFNNKIDITGVKSSVNQRLVIGSSSMKNKDESDVLSSPGPFLLDRKHKSNKMTETRSIKFSSTSIINETKHLNSDAQKSTKHINPSLTNNSMPHIDSSKISTSCEFPTLSELPKIKQTTNNIHRASLTIESFNISSRIWIEIWCFYHQTMFHFSFTLLFI
jgi:hypothetical protein